MSMLRDESLVALDNLALAHREAAQGYEDAAGMLTDGDLAALFTTLGQQHRDMGQALEPHIHRLGDHPSEPDPDRALIQKAVRHVKSALATDAHLTLLRERERDEEAVAEHIAEALHQSLPDETTALLIRQRDVVAAAQARLARARAAAATG